MITPIRRFDSVVERCTNLISLFTAIEKGRASGAKVPATVEEQCDLIRSAVVLAVSGMDAYFTEKFATMLVPYLKKKGPNRHLVNLLEKAGLNTEAALDMISMERPYRRIRLIVDGFLFRYTAQQIGPIDSLFQAYGMKDFSYHAANRIGQKTLLGRIEKLVSRRHDIVHDADLNSRGELQKIDDKQVWRQIEYLTKFIHSCDYLADRILK
jgi:hypothetical protein